MKAPPCKHKNKKIMKTLLATALAVALAATAHARSYDLKYIGFASETEGRNKIFSDKTKHQHFTLKLGPSSKIDSTTNLEIRVATVLKNIETKQSVINDIAVFDFAPTNKKAAVFDIFTGAAAQVVDNWKHVGGDYSHGYGPNGVVVEIWQSGKCIKHLSGTVGNQAKTALVPGETECALLDIEGYKSYSERSFDNQTKIKLRP